MWYYPGLPLGDPNFLARPDGTLPPADPTATGYVDQPGAKEDKMFLQLVKANVQYFLLGVELALPSLDQKVCRALGFDCLARRPICVLKFRKAA